MELTEDLCKAVEDGLVDFEHLCYDAVGRYFDSEDYSSDGFNRALSEMNRHREIHDFDVQLRYEQRLLEITRGN